MRVLPQGSFLGGHEIVDVLGQGGMGVVYKAADARTGRLVALKVVSREHASGEDFVGRFRREGRAGATLRHQNITALHDAGMDGPTPYLVFELVKGGSLKDRLKERGPFPWREAAALGAGIARGLQAVHEAGLVHRDLKPGNVLLGEDGSPKLSDFGLVGAQSASLAVSSALTKTGELLGTLEYMAPEQADSAATVDARADLYSLGALLYALVAGRPPFQGTGYVVLRHHIADRPTPPRRLVPDLPERFERLILRLLEKNPLSRPQTAERVARELEAIGEEPDAPASRRRPLLVLAAPALGFVFFLAGLFFFLSGKRDETPEPAPPVANAPPPPPVVSTKEKARDAAARKRAEAELARARELVFPMKVEVEKLRDRVFQSDPPVAQKTLDETREAMRRYLDDDLPAEKTAVRSRALSRLGLLPAGYDLRKGVLGMAEGANTLAWYDDRSRNIWLVAEKRDAASDLAIFRALCAALEDQWFDTKEYLSLARFPDDDEQNARRFVQQGESSWLLTVYALAQRGASDRARETCLQRAAMTRDDYARGHAKPGETPAPLPLYVFRSFIEPVTKGALLVGELQQSGGWKAVDELWRRPPRSTKEVLDARLLKGERARARRLALPDLSAKLGEGFRLAHENTIGQLGVECLLEDHGVGREALAGLVQGFLGDRLQSYEKDGETTVVWISSWESVERADEFGRALGEALKDRGEGSGCLGCREERVFLVLGAPQGRAVALADAARDSVKLSPVEEGEGK